MTATVTVLADRMKSVSQRTRTTVQAIKGYRDLTDAGIATRIGWSRQKVQSYVNGPTKFTDEAFAAFAYALDVPEFVLLMERDDALRWILDHPANGPQTPGGLEITPRAWNGERRARVRTRRMNLVSSAAEAA